MSILTQWPISLWMSATIHYDTAGMSPTFVFSVMYSKNKVALGCVVVVVQLQDPDMAINKEVNHANTRGPAV